MAERLAPGTAARIAQSLDTGLVEVARDGIATRHAAQVGLVLLDEGEGEDEAVPACLADRVAFHLDLDGVPVSALAAAPPVSDPAAPRAHPGNMTERSIRAAGLSHPEPHPEVPRQRPRRRAPDISETSGGLLRGSHALAPQDEVPGGSGDRRWLDVSGVSPDAGRTEVPPEPDAADTLCTLALRLGIASLRAPLLALRVARLHAALAGRDAVEDPDLALAAALVLAPRARCWPQEVQETPDQPAEPPPETSDEAGESSVSCGEESGEDRILAAAAASLPPGLLARLLAGADPRTRSPGAGRAGAAATAQRGRPVGARPGDPRRGRLALIETLRAAAPWQRLRRGAGEARLRITADDLRIRRLVQKRETTTIFAVDASGSAALERLAEAKGAVESLLAECYVRRDRVALVAFRGRGADLLLVPTRSLVRAKRALASLPGGGGTPLAAGIEAAGRLAAAERRGGRSPVVLLLTDGRANVDRSGAPGRAQAAADALAAARVLAAEGTRALVIDTAARPQDSARALAAAMAARYLAMPQADAARLTRAVREAAPAC
ncbi:VWA domain-containing protein [Methylobacterium aquaticum]|nr:VWA domain-containing protein [Methylobacterium aquaticum]